MKEDWALIIALLGAAGSIVAMAKFWMAMGAAARSAEAAAAASAQVSFKVETLMEALNEHKVETAKVYATRVELAEAERAIATGFNSFTQGIYDRLDKLAARLDSLIDLGKK